MKETTYYTPGVGLLPSIVAVYEAGRMGDEKSTAETRGSGDLLGKISPWNSEQPVFYGCFNWMIQIFYMGNGCFTKHPFINGCLEFQVLVSLVGG